MSIKYFNNLISSVFFVVLVSIDNAYVVVVIIKRLKDISNTGERVSLHFTSKFAKNTALSVVFSTFSLFESVLKHSCLIHYFKIKFMQNKQYTRDQFASLIG